MSGTAKVGNTLTVNPGATTPAAYSTSVYWYRNGIGWGAFGGSHLTYELTAADAGAQITALVTYQQYSWDSTVTMTRTLDAGIIANGTFQVSQEPTISGTSSVGNTLIADPGTTFPAASSVAYQWRRNGVAIAGQTGSSYAVVPDDLGASISVAVTYGAAGYDPLMETASTPSAVAAGQLQSTQGPTITGTATVGHSLMANPGSTSPAAASVAYQWLRNGLALSGQTGPIYVIGADDVGTHISVAITYSTIGYGPLTKTASAPTVPAPTSTPTVPAPTPTPPTATSPSRMQAPKVVARGAKVIVKWKAADPNGSAITRYLVDISKGKDKTASPSARKAVFKHLKPGKYRIRVAARNVIGTSPYSVWVKIRIR